MKITVWEKVRTIVYVVPVIIIAVLVGRNLVIKTTLEKSIRDILGNDVSIESLSISMTDSIITVYGFKVNNPPGFHSEAFIYCPKVEGVFDRRSLFGKKLKMKEVHADIPRISFSRNSKGELNIEQILKQYRREYRRKQNPLTFRIDSLVLSIGKAVYTDKRADTDLSWTKDLDIVGQEIRGITSVEDLVNRLWGLIIPRLGTQEELVDLFYGGEGNAGT